MSRSMGFHGPYLNSGVPDEIVANLIEFLPNDDALTYEEVLLQQAGMYQSFQERDKNIKRRQGVMRQEAIDEALARSLQDLGDGFDDLIISDHSSRASGSTESPISTPSMAHTSSSNSRQDPIDPDSMQYEELLELGESIGTENRGISESRISRLPSSKYRSGLFSKKKKKDENCVVCQMDFNYGERLITLPCSHQYHIKCITDWLKLKKNCPICQEEVV